MKRKYLITALLCSVCLTVPSVAGAAEKEADTVQESAAENEAEAAEAEGEDKTESEDSTEGEDTEAEGEDKLEGEIAEETEGEASEEEEKSDEEEEPQLERPEYKALDFVKLGEYKNLVVKREELGLEDVTDEDVESTLQDNVKSMAASREDVQETLTEGKVEDGDVANIDYVGKKDGEAFDGGTAEGYDLEIGSGTFIPGFEEGLVGAAIGETVDLNLTFPESYGNTELAGQEVVFTVTVNSVKRMPELTDEVIKTLTDGEYEDIDSYREFVKKDLEEQLEQQIQSAMQDQAFIMVQDASEITGYPEGLQEYTEQFIHNYYKAYAEMYGMEFKDFLSAAMGITEEEFDEQAVEVAKTNMDTELYLSAILESENISITEEDYTELAKNYGFESVDEMRETVDSAIMESAYLGMIQEKAYEILGENTVLEEKEA